MRPRCCDPNVYEIANLISRVSCQKGPTRHAYAWQIGPFWQDMVINIRFHFQFGRSLETTFGGHIKWLQKRVLIYRIRINIANYVKYKYFCDDDIIDDITVPLWKFSDLCSRQTVGNAGDDIIYHILALHVSDLSMMLPSILWNQTLRDYCQISNISCTKSPNLNVSRLVLQLSLSNPPKPGVKSGMKM